MAKVKTKLLVDAAARCGVIENTPAGRKSYEGWLKRDPEGAQDALLRATRATARAVKAEASGATASDYPAHWRGRVSAAKSSRVRVGAPKAAITQAGD